jgi:uncharacterized protein YlxW (UPF0749 family)
MRAQRRPLAARRLGIVLVCALAGFLFAVNARVAGAGHDERRPLDLKSLVQAETERADAMTTEVAALQVEVDELTDTKANFADGTLGADRNAVAAGWVALAGPGVEVRLSDAPADAVHPDYITDDELVVHQQDVQAVINALWSGGAEAMSLQGQRVISTSAFRCVGNVLALQGRLYSPPYVIQAIGDPDALMDALAADPAIQNYLSYVDVVGLGWSAKRVNDVTLPAYDGAVELRYANAVQVQAQNEAR